MPGENKTSCKPLLEAEDMDSTSDELSDAENPRPLAVERHNVQQGKQRSSGMRKKSCCDPYTWAVVIAFALLGGIVGYILGIVLNIKFGYHSRQNIKVPGTWHTRFADYGTESCLRLVDVDGDGLDDVIMGITLAKDIGFMLTAQTMEQYCKEHGMPTPCIGNVVALRGYDGKLLWRTDAYIEIFELNCHSIDVNRDGVNDCIATGRLGDIRAINVKDGRILWEGSSNEYKRQWNIYNSAKLPDFDYDGVPEIVTSHGGDPTIPAHNLTRKAGWLMMLSGATGRPIGRPLEMPEMREIYCPPVIHTLPDGSNYILFGSGGETVGGSFWAISVPDFYRYVHGYPNSEPVPNVSGLYKQWGPKPAGKNGLIEIFRSEEKGVMVPPVLIDINRDGVKDVLMSGFDGTTVLFDGRTLKNIWKLKIDDRESYSTPAPGYFNDDDVIDFMVHFSVGAWPHYTSSDTIVIDGRDGAILWNLTTNKYDVSSDLVVKTTSQNRDLFLFRAQGRRGNDPTNLGSIHGATGIQRVITRDIDSMELVDREVDAFEGAEDILLDSDHSDQRTHRAAYQGPVECERDQTVNIAEMFAIDRTIVDRPLKIWEFGSEKFYYTLTENDRKLQQQAIVKAGKNLTEEEIPWQRGKRKAVEENTTLCIVIQPDERVTSAFGDVDGDGRLDVIIQTVSVGLIRDEYNRFVKMKYNVDVFKITLEDAIGQGMYVDINMTLHERMSITRKEPSVATLTFKPMKEQPWSAYLGTFGDSIFREFN